MIVGIYGLQNKLKPEKWNIGQSWDIYKRWEYYKMLNCDGQPKIYNAIKKYGYDGFEKRIIEMCDPDIDQESLDLKESSWINHYNSIKNGYNLKGGGSKGKHSEETKQKIREARSRQIIGKNHVSKEACEKMRADRTGIPLLEEHRIKLSISHIGNKQTEESKEKISKSLLGIKRGHWTEERRLRKSLSMVGKNRGPYKSINQKELTLV